MGFIRIIIVSATFTDSRCTDACIPGGGIQALRWSAPFFLFLFAALAVGACLGGFATWLRQARWRRSAREARDKAERLQSEMQRLQQTGRAVPPVNLLPGDRNRDAA